MSRPAPTVVRQVSGAHAQDDERFIVFHEVATEGGSKFIPNERELARRELFEVLLAQGFPEEDALRMIKEALAAFRAR